MLTGLLNLLCEQLGHLFEEHFYINLWCSNCTMISNWTSYPRKCNVTTAVVMIVDPTIEIECMETRRSDTTTIGCTGIVVGTTTIEITFTLETFVGIEIVPITSSVTLATSTRESFRPQELLLTIGTPSKTNHCALVENGANKWKAGPRDTKFYFYNGNKIFKRRVEREKRRQVHKWGWKSNICAQKKGSCCTKIPTCFWMWRKPRKNQLLNSAHYCHLQKPSWERLY